MLVKPLNQRNRRELKCWLASLEFKNKRLRKRCADCRYVAKLVEKQVPELCTASTYAECGKNFKGRLQNWQRFNEKVLAKLWLSQRQEQLEQFAHSKRHAAEHLLYELMRRLAIMALERPVVEESLKDSEFVTVRVYETLADTGGIVHKNQRMRDWAKYEEALKAAIGKSNFLGRALRKIEVLESVANMRDEEMCQRVEMAWREKASVAVGGLEAF